MYFKTFKGAVLGYGYGTGEYGFSNTDKTEYRCYRTKQSNPTLWNQ